MYHWVINEGICHTRLPSKSGFNEHFESASAIGFSMQAVVQKLRSFDIGHRIKMMVVLASAHQNLKRLQLALLCIFAIWIANSLASLFWSFWSVPMTPDRSEVIINPPGQVKRVDEASAVNLEAMLGLGLFGDAVSSVDPVVSEVFDSAERDGIEQGARETRLDLTLVGTLVTSSDGLGTAVIESRKEQITYAVGDTLPVGSDVTLAKVLPKQVVLDNGGKFELLTLFEESPLAATISPSEIDDSQKGKRQDRRATSAEPSRQAAVVVDSAEAVAFAGRYRERMYSEPESLARAVKISAVSDENGIYGYRVAPGTDGRAFQALGFEPGDIVTAINGLDLGDPANTISLYQTMREATEATFDLQRGKTAITLSVSLGQVR